MPPTGTSIKLKNKFEQIFSKKPFFLNAQNGHLINSANPIFFLIALLIFISGHSSAQIMGEAVHITTQNGLPNDICYDVNQDTRGYIWIGTEYGAARFNGRKFRSFSTHDGLSSNYIIGLTPYKDGVAMASWGGGFEAIANDEVKPKNEHSSEVSKTYYITYGEHSYFLGGGSNFYQVSNKGEQFETKPFYIGYNSGSYSILPSHPKPDQIVKAKIISANQEVFVVYDPVEYPISHDDVYGIFKLVPQNENLKLEAAFDFLKLEPYSYVGWTGQYYLIGGKNKILLCSREKLLETITLPNTTGVIYKVLPYKGGYVAMTRDFKGNKHGYYYKNKLLHDLHDTYDIRYSLSDIFIDEESNLWISTYGGGIYMYPANQEDRIRIGQEILDDPNILDMAVSNDGTVYLLSRNFLYTLDDSLSLIGKTKLSNLCKEINIKNDSPELICVDARTNTPNKSEVNQVLGFQNTYLPGLGNVNADNGIVSINGEPVFKDKGNTLQIQSMAYDAKLHRLYFANFLYLFSFDLKNKKVIDSLVLNRQLCADRIHKIVAENGVVWIATNQCLHLWQQGSITTIQTEEGPIEGPINDLIVDGNDLYVASLNGVHILRKGNWFLLNKKTGLISDFVKALLLDEKKRLWVAGVNGITVVDLQKAFESGAPKLCIDQQACSFEVDIIGFVRPESVQLQYSLDGFKYKDMQPGFVQFCGQKHGTHKIRFRARKWDGFWTYSNNLTFEIHIPWYKRDWGLLVLVTIVFLLIFTIIFYSLVKSRKRNQHLQSLISERARLENELNDARSNIAKDFHDDMGNKMARISILANILTQADPGDTNIRPRLEQIRNDAGDLYKSTRDFIWALKPEHNKLSALITYLTDFGQEYFDSLGIDFETSSNVDREVDMPYMANRNIVMIGKEAMTNTAKHGGATLMRLSFMLRPDQLTIEWADNGLANTSDMENSKRGIANMKERASKLGGQLYIVVDGGTMVKLVMPLHTTHKG